MNTGSTKGSIGLGLTTRRMSVATCQDKKTGKAVAFFLGLSVLILGVNCLAESSVSKLKHYLVDETIGVVEALNTPVRYAQNTVASLRVIMDVRKNNEVLAAENARLLEWYQAANRLESENKALRELLHMKDEDALEFQSGKVIGDAETQYSHTILVKLGTNNGVEKGQGVLSQEGLIGRVIETGDRTSRVLLLGDINSRVPVTIDGTQDRAIMAGVNDGDPVLDHLPEGHNVQTGQKVVTSGHGGIFPYGVPVGETYMKSNGQIAVRPYANANRTNYVQIVNYGVPAGSARRNVASGATGTLR